jgi:carbamoyl-phosphate synthase large subunit
VDALLNGEIQLVVNTTGNVAVRESFSLRRTALLQRVPYFTTVSGALAAVHAIAVARAGGTAVEPLSLQEYQAGPTFDAESAPTNLVGYR